MEKWDVAAQWGLLALLAMCLVLWFAVDGIRLLRRLRSSGVPKDTYNACAFHIAVAMMTALVMASVTTVYAVRDRVDGTVFTATILGLVLLLQTHLWALSLFLDERSK